MDGGHVGPHRRRRFAGEPLRQRFGRRAQRLGELLVAACYAPRVLEGTDVGVLARDSDIAGVVHGASLLVGWEASTAPAREDAQSFTTQQQYRDVLPSETDSVACARRF